MATLLDEQLFEFFAVLPEPGPAPEGLACLLCGAWTGAAQCDCHLRRRHDDLSQTTAGHDEIEEFSDNEHPEDVGAEAEAEEVEEIEEIEYSFDHEEEPTAPYEPDSDERAYEQRYAQTWRRYGRCEDCRAKHTVDELALADLRAQVNKLREQNARLQQRLDETAPLQQENLRLHEEVDRLKRQHAGELVDRPKRACRRDLALS